jgi:hypothetical protein
MALCMDRIRRGSAAALVALGVAACDSNMPETFNAEATSGDVNAMTGIFAAPVFASFAAASGDVDVVTGAGASASIAQLRSGADGRQVDAARYAGRLRAILPAEAPSAGFSASSADIPPDALGKTYVYDPATDTYVASDIPGAPANGVRFLLYAVDPVTHQVAEPLNQLGYADVIDQSGSDNRAARIIVVSGSTTYLDYGVEASGTATGGRVLVDGFVTDGTTRADFRLDNRIVMTSLSSGQATLDYAIEVPTRDLEFGFDLTVSLDAEAESAALALGLDLSGPNGHVNLSGDYTTLGGSGSLDVDVNGEDFATIQVTTTPTTTTIEILGAGGNALTEQERQALENIFEAFEEAFDVVDDLLRPVDNLTAG